MKCPKCGKAVADDAEKCVWCGLELNVQATPPLVVEHQAPATPAGPPVTVEPQMPRAEPPRAAPPPPPPPPPPPVEAPPARRMTPAQEASTSPYVVETPPAPPAPTFRPRRRPPRDFSGLIKVLVILVILGGLGYGAWYYMNTIRPRQRAQAAADSVRAAQAADSVLRAESLATLATMAWFRIVGDLPDDAIIYLEETQKTGRIIQAFPGTWNLEIETSEFEPWERRITLRAGDTLRVNVELELKAQDSTVTIP